MKPAKLLAQTAAISALFAAPAMADQLYSFSNVNLAYTNWSKGSEEKANRVDFESIGLEVGVGYDWGDIYGFFDIENPTSAEWKADMGSEDAYTRFAGKAVAQVNLGQTKFNFYGHYYFATSTGGDVGFFEQNIITGMSYDLSTSFGLWFKPFIGTHFVAGNFLGAGFNGYMGGWTLGYNFELLGQPFMITNWNEIEFARAEEYKVNNGTTGINGGVSLWWTPVPQVTFGVTYRYADNKLGQTQYQNATIFHAKYNF